MRICHSTLTFMTLLMLATSIGLSSGCGQKGALYHPADSQPLTDKDKTRKPTSKTQPQP